MFRISSERGVGHVAIVLLLLVVGVVGFAGYTVMNSQKDNDKTASSVQAKVDSVPELKEADTTLTQACLLYTSDAADERSSVDLGGRRIIKKKKTLKVLIKKRKHK